MASDERTLKRKTINDFFQASTQAKYKKSYHGTCESPRINTKVPGLSLIPNFVTIAEEKALVNFLDQQHWRTDLSRRVIHYGGTYCLMPPRDANAEERKRIEQNIITAKSLPPDMTFLTERLFQFELFEPLNRPTYCIVNEYKDNQGISAHVENFKFASPVCGLTLGNGDWIRFTELGEPDDGSVRSGKAAEAQKTGKQVDIWMPSRSLLIMSDESRYRWQHSIPRSRKGRFGKEWRRMSLTFRADRKSATT